MEYGDQPYICLSKITNSLAILILRKPLKTSTRLVGLEIWTWDLPNESLVRYHGATSLGFSDLLRSFQMLKTEWGAESNGKLPHLFISSKAATLVPELAVEDLPLGRLQPWCLSLHLNTCRWPEHTDDDDDDDDIQIHSLLFILHIISLNLFNQWRKGRHYTECVKIPLTGFEDL